MDKYTTAVDKQPESGVFFGKAVNIFRCSVDKPAGICGKAEDKHGIIGRLPVENGRQAVEKQGKAVEKWG